MPGLIHIGVLFEAESGIGSKLTMKAMQKQSATRHECGRRKGEVNTTAKGVRESESRTGTWLVSPGRWPPKKKKDVAINKSLNMILRAVATAECCMYLSEVKRSSLAAKYPYFKQNITVIASDQH
jgi:hypothetical protein